MLSRDDQQLSYPCAASHTPVSASVTLLEPQDGSISSGGFEDDELVSAAGVELSRSPWVRLGSDRSDSVRTHFPFTKFKKINGESESTHTMRYHFARYK